MDKRDPVVSLSMPAMRPISVYMPVAVTTARPRPYVVAVPLEIMYRSARGARPVAPRPAGGPPGTPPLSQRR